MTVLAAWKVGAIPVPVRWDLPDWERERVLEVIDGVTVGVDDLPWLEATADARRHTPAVGGVAADQRDLQQRLDRRAQGDPDGQARACSTR